MNQAEGFKGRGGIYKRRKNRGDIESKLKEMQRMEMRQRARWGELGSEVDTAGERVGIADLFLSNSQTEKRIYA